MRVDIKGNASVESIEVKSVGFTLVELVVTLCLLALFAGGSMLLLSTPLRKAQSAGALSDFHSLHEWSLRHSNLERITMTINLKDRDVVCVGKQTRHLNFSEHFQPKTVIVDGARRDTDSVDIDYLNGACTTFAIRFGNGGSNDRWLFVCGPSGQTESYPHDETMAERLLDWTAKWSNAY